MLLSGQSQKDKRLMNNDDDSTSKYMQSSMNWTSFSVLNNLASEICSS